MFKSPANEFLLHKCRKKNEKMIFLFQIRKKNAQVQRMSFSYIAKRRNNRKMKNWIFPFKSEKKLQVQLMRFSYINVETKMKKLIFPFHIRKNLQVQSMRFCCIKVETKICKN